jgi:zinc protease
MHPLLPVSLPRAVLAVAAIRLLPLALLAGCATVNVVQKQGVSLRPLEFPLRTLSYPSGLRVLVERDSRTPLAGIFLVVGSGSTSDPAGKEGLAHYIEHLTFRSRPFGAQGFRSLMEGAGWIDYNAFTELDETVYFEVGLASSLHEMLRLEGARMSAPVVKVTEAVRATELDVVRNELRLGNETGFVGEVLGELQSAVFPQGNPYARSVIGTHQSLAALREADVQAFVAAHYRPENMTLLILGDVDLATADRLVWESLPHELLGAPAPVRLSPRMPAAAPPVPPSPPQAEGLPRREAAVAAPEIWLAWSLPRSFDSEAYLLAFVRISAQRRLSKVVFDDKDMVGISMKIYPGVQASMLLCRIELNKGEHPEESRDRVLKELPGIFNARDDEQFGRDRRVAVVEEVSSAQDLVARGIKRATITHFSQDPTLYSRAVRDLVAMRRAQVREYSAPYVTRERARAILFVPPAGGSLASGSGSLSGPSSEMEPGPASPALPSGVASAEGRGERLRALLPESPERSTFRLSNGLSVILDRRAGLPLVSAGLLLPAMPEKAEERAASEVVRTVGTPRRLLNGPPDAFGGSIWRETGRDHISYSVEGASGNTEIILATLAEYARAMAVDRTDWVQFNRYVIPRSRRYESEPRNVANRSFLGALLPGSPYGLAITSAQLEGTSQEAAQRWIQRTHSPANATLAVVGDFDPTEVSRMIGTSFGNWPGEAVEGGDPAAPKIAASAVPEVRFLVTDRPGATQSQIQFGCLFPDGNKSALVTRHEVGARLLQNRLWEVSREKMGATYGLQVDSVALRGGTSYLEARSAVETGKLAPVLGVLKQALGSLGAELASQDELAWAKLKRASRSATADMTNRGIVAAELAKARLGAAVGGAGRADELISVSAEDVRTDFQYCLRGNPTLSIVGDERAVRAALKEGWR